MENNQILEILQEIKSSVNELNQRVDELDKRLNQRIDELDERMSKEMHKLEERLGNKIDEIDKRLSNKIDNLEKLEMQYQVEDFKWKEEMRKRLNRRDRLIDREYSIITKQIEDRYEDCKDDIIVLQKGLKSTMELATDNQNKIIKLMRS